MAGWGGKTYGELLKDPRWQRMRLEILERDEFRCQTCGDNKNTLHVHHRRYLKGHKPWEYDASDLVTLCEGCHSIVTDLMKVVQTSLGALDSIQLQYVLGFSVGIRCSNENPVAPPAEMQADVRTSIEADHCAFLAAGVGMSLTVSDVHKVIDRGGYSLGALCAAANDRMEKHVNELLSGRLTEDSYQDTLS